MSRTSDSSIPTTYSLRSLWTASLLLDGASAKVKQAHQHPFPGQTLATAPSPLHSLPTSSAVWPRARLAATNCDQSQGVSGHHPTHEPTEDVYGHGGLYGTRTISWASQRATGDRSCETLLKHPRRPSMRIKREGGTNGCG